MPTSSQIESILVALEKEEKEAKEAAQSEKAEKAERERVALEAELCMRYVLDQAAGSSPKVWALQALQMDCMAAGELRPDRRSAAAPAEGKKLADFVAEANEGQSEALKLTAAEVAAIRIYTTAAYRTINEPLRKGDEEAPSHPLPVTVMCLHRGLKKLRKAREAEDFQPLTLWRGIKNTHVPADFLRCGGVELAPIAEKNEGRAPAPAAVVAAAAALACLWWH